MKKDVPEEAETNTEITEAPNPENTQEEPQVDKLQKSKRTLPTFLKNRRNLIIIGTLLLLIVCGTTAYFLTKKDASKQASTTSETSNDTQEEIVVEPTKPIGAVTFLTETKRLGDLGLFKNPVEYFAIGSVSDIEYFQIGTTADGGQVIGFFTGGALDETMHYAIKYSDRAEILGRSSPSLVHTLEDTDPNNQTYNQEFLNQFKAALANNVTLNTIDAIQFPDFPHEATVAGQKIISSRYASTPDIYLIKDGLKGIRGTFFSNPATGTQEIGTQGEIKFYRLTIDTQPTYKIVEIRASYKGLFAVSYVLNGEISRYEEKPIEATWTKGINNNSGYFSASGGCGSANGFVVATNINKAQLIEVGKSKQGQKLFQLPTSHPLVKELYEKDYGTGEYVENASLKNLTIDQFTDQHAYFLVENAFGDYMVQQRNDIFIRGGCAKPVIYLYPEQATRINVVVGADVTLSDPFYPDGGWKNVLAQPNGQLEYKGQNYSSLFWEGYGHGAYPEITKGIVVRTSDALTIIRQQLHAQGLNEQETNDFIDFWQHKLSAKPFTRLTWFGNAELNQLAPLTINPRPRTVIRVFLDMEGLNAPVNIPAQTFRAPKRYGFTVVEWGGLARDGSVPALR